MSGINPLSFTITGFGKITSPRSSELEFAYLLVWRKISHEKLGDILNISKMIKGYCGDAYARNTYTREYIEVKMKSKGHQWNMAVLEDCYRNAYTYTCVSPEFTVIDDFKNTSLVDTTMHGGFTGNINDIPNEMAGLVVPFKDGKIHGKITRKECIENCIANRTYINWLDAFVPCIHMKTVTEIHFKDGIPHNEEGQPTAMWNTIKDYGCQFYEYIVDGVRHRENGPAVAWHFGNSSDILPYIKYYNRGKLHNSNGPAYTKYDMNCDVDSDYLVVKEFYYRNGTKMVYPTSIFNYWDARVKLIKFVKDGNKFLRVWITYRNYVIFRIATNDKYREFTPKSISDARTSLSDIIDDEEAIQVVMKYINRTDADFLNDDNALDFEYIKKSFALEIGLSPDFMDQLDESAVLN